MKNKKRLRSQVVLPDNPPAVEALTIGWMLSILLLLIFDVVTYGSRSYLANVDNTNRGVQALYAMCFFAGLVSAAICVLLTVLVHRMRHDPPPKNIVRFAIFLAVLPFVMVLVNLFA
jgi:hypothetical protein